MIIIPKGTKITCPQCSKHVATTVKEIIEGQMFSQDLIEYELGEENRSELAQCSKCGQLWAGQIDDGSVFVIHTEKGWAHEVFDYNA